MKVRTLPRTFSGRRGGQVLELGKDDAKDWIARGWATAIPADEPNPKSTLGISEYKRRRLRAAAAGKNA